MEHDSVIVDRLSQMGFRVYSDAEILRLSVKEVTNPQLFDNLQLPTIGGLYDPALGSSRNDDECASCGQSGRYCPGHMGHINLALPVFNPVFFKTLFKILQGTCLSCHRLYVSDVEGSLFVHRMKLLEQGDVVGSKALQQFVWQYQAEKGEDRDTFAEDLLVKLKQMAKELIKESSDGSAHCTKMVDAEMSELVNTMLKQFFINVKTCPHCKRETLALRQEYFSRISVKSGRDKRPRVQKAASKRKPTPAETVPPETEMDLDIGEELEEREEVDGLLVKGKGQCLIMPHLARQIMRKVWHKDGKVLRKVFRCLEQIDDADYPTDMFFLTAILVPPSRFRPVSVMGDRKFENPQTANLSRVLTDSYEIRQLLVNISVDLNNSTDLTVQQEGNTAMAELQAKWIQLQTHVNCLIDSDLDKLSNDANKLQGIKQLLEKKEGLFRMHMMGKRVNYAARSVISPDPCINTNQIGVPAVFAQKLTYPQPVTPWNVHELRQCVINGPNTYPGASAVVNEDGSVTKLSPTSLIQREAVAKQLLTPGDASGRHQLPKQVLRHLKDGDMMLLNRQPTLHRPSIQAHRARVLPGLKTLRLHYSNCKAYNADFDGDEMNAHFPQSELCRAEAYGIASTDFQYLVPKDGSPLAGLIQDHLVAGVALTIRGQFFFRDDYCNLLQSALTNKRGRIRLLHPAIVYPRCMWSGKQVISTLLLNIIPKDKPPLSLDGRAKINEKRWVKRTMDKASRHLEHAAARRKSKKRGQNSVSSEGTGTGERTQGEALVGMKTRMEPYLTLAAAQEKTKELGESTVLIDHGELLQGVLDKAQCGPSSFGLVHCVYELYGGEIAGQLLTCLGRLFTAFLKLNGFTLGVEDILVNDKSEAKRREEIDSSHMAGQTAALEAFGVTEECGETELLHFLQEAHCDQDRSKMNQLDARTKIQTNKIAEKIMSVVGQDLFKSFPDNNLQLMVESGAKGSMANCQQISSLLGQIELEGRRPPLMNSGRSLPSFLPYDLSLRAGGFVTGRFLTGIRPQEYFFHCMAGREGLIDTAVKTSRSGYLQRCLSKHLEGVTVHYDMTVRDSDASVIQFIYGEDGLEVSKTPFLQEQQMPFLLKNQHVISGLEEPAKGEKHIEKHKKKVHKWLRKHQEGKARGSGFLDFCCARLSDQHRQQKGDVNGNTKPGKTAGKPAKRSVLEVEWRSLDPKQKRKFLKKHQPCPDPVLSQYWPQLHPGVISEKMQGSVNLIQQQLREVGQSSNDRAEELQSVRECEVLTRLVNNKVMRSLCEPGEAVGLVCAQSIGEPSTQMTLNTFHFAGRGEMNVTLGIPRLREVLMTASADILTPAMDIPVKDTPEAKAGAVQLQKKLNRVFLSDVLQEMKICDFLQASSSSSDRIDRKRMYRIHLTILPKKCYSDKLHMKQKDIVRRIEKELIGRIARAARKVMDKHAMRQPADLVSQSTVRNVESTENEATADLADDGESDVEANDGDATAAKELARHTDTQEYEGEEEEREEVGDATQPDDMEEDMPGEKEPVQDDEEQQEAMDIEAVKSLGCVHDYQRDRKGKWCEVVLQFEASRHLVDMKSLVEREASKVVLQQVKGIKRCMLIDRDNEATGQKSLHLVTEGVNLQEMMKYFDVLDVNSMYTNSIVEIQDTYGIEAAHKAIIKEVQSVFDAYKITVNYRHLSLLADYMTCEGFYKGFNRMAISSNPSPLQKITFETSMNFLVNACTNGRPDHLQSPTARIVAGQVVSSGTGSFDIIQPLQV